MSDVFKPRITVAIIGGGLVGSLNACFLAKRGYIVNVFEMREDIRLSKMSRGRSINLALSVRGLEALRAVGAEGAIRNFGIPMYARMIHDKSGKCRPIPYGRKGQNIMSVDRRLLNMILLDEAEKYTNITINFCHKMVQCDFDDGTVILLHEERAVTVKVDLIVGCDGAFSTVRQQMMKVPDVRFDYLQNYIPHGYMELNIPAAANDEFAMIENVLHIWPRDEFMMIALPNVDKSYTTTIFMPFTLFNSIRTEAELMKFFRETFPDAFDLIKEDSLKKTFMTSRALPMVTVKGFEDCIVLNDMLDRYNDDLALALSAYTEFRHVDVKAMCDLALYNYMEMRSFVNSTSFLWRKKLDTVLNRLFPSTWVPLYSMVTFTRTRYHLCLANKGWQDKLLAELGWGLSGLGLFALACFLHSRRHSLLALHSMLSLDRLCGKAASCLSAML